MFEWANNLLGNQRGETPNPGTTPNEPTTVPDERPTAAPGEEGAEGTPPNEEGSEGKSGGDESQPGYKEGFMAPKDMPAEIKGHFDRMLSSYQRKLEEVAGIKDNAENVDKFYSDPAYARQVITARANQLGMNLTEASDGGSPSRPAATVGVNQVPAPDHLVKQFETRYGEGNEAQARTDADMLYNNTLDTMRTVLKPLQEKAEETRQADAETEYKRQAESLSQAHPGWEDNEDAMDGLLEFMQGTAQNHPVYGSKLLRLYQLNDLVNGNGNATAEAVRRIGNAGKNRITTGRPGGTGIINTDDRVMKAKNNQEAFKIAADAAVDELRREGLTVPD